MIGFKCRYKYPVVATFFTRYIYFYFKDVSCQMHINDSKLITQRNRIITAFYLFLSFLHTYHSTCKHFYLKEIINFILLKKNIIHLCIWIHQQTQLRKRAFKKSNIFQKEKEWVGSIDDVSVTKDIPIKSISTFCAFPLFDCYQISQIVKCRTLSVKLPAILFLSQIPNKF